MEEAERSAVRETEAATREASWHAAQQQRLDADGGPVRDPVPADLCATNAPSAAPEDATAIATWEARAGELRERRDRMAARLAEHDGIRGEDGSARARGRAHTA